MRPNMARPGAAPRVCGVRGATGVCEDTPEAIYNATRELLVALVERNQIDVEDIVSVIFTVTPDLTSAFPAMAARELGWTEVPLLCTTEIPVTGALAKCIRVLLLIETWRSRADVQHIYLHSAQQLRPDLEPRHV